MIADQDREQLTWLIKHRAEGVPTEELFILIAETKGLLNACRQLIAETGGHPRNIPQWLTAACQTAHINTREFFTEINTAVALFTPAQHPRTTHHILLGLEADASREAIKQRYRELCRHYHPDATGHATAQDTEKFIAITKAYHALMHSADTIAGPAAQSPPQQHWRRPAPPKKRALKQRGVLWFALLALVLVVSSLMIARAYNTQIMMIGLKNKNSAFVPPLKKEAAPDTQHRQPAPEPQQYAVVPATHVSSPQPGTASSAHHSGRPDQSGTMAQKKDKQSGVTLSSTTALPPADLDSPTSQRRVTTDTPPSVAVRTATNPKTESRQQPPTPAATASPPPPDKPSAALSQLPPSPQPVPAASLLAASTPEPAATPASIVSTAALERHTQQQLDAFLRQYSTAYRQKNLTTFRSFFTPDATENGKSLQDVLPVYTQLFAETRTLHLQVDPRHWQHHNSTINFLGRFTIDLKYLNGTSVQGQGDIHFHLIEDGERLLIQALNYVFDQ